MARRKSKKGALKKIFPILDWLPKYKKKWLRFDLIAGITVAAIFIPEAIAYSEIVGMPPQTSATKLAA